ncbi:hypothetical protein DSCW_03920 [Desulfosarcina widdelii]|uniref:Leucyl/phenylalanyl-tRNA--protein transferase n=1 Tax=Desulfosarcina widdelii TaxID=947919 RepID=A0A5K7YX48_9BACT|nr:hypothetical protein DSCW_03920 [Desulfosarcina widdelii]
MTWIKEDIIKAYYSLYKKGYVHSIEVWDNDDNLIGGLYGVAIGHIFFTESMFSKRPHASKIALAYLNCHLQAWGYIVNDVKRYTEFWKNQGARLISRSEFILLLREHIDTQKNRIPWKLDETLNIGFWDPIKGKKSNCFV